MSIQNFPKIPKIALIKPCDQAKDTKNKKYTFLNTIYWIFYDFVVLLRGATLNVKSVKLVCSVCDANHRT